MTAGNSASVYADPENPTLEQSELNNRLLRHSHFYA